MRSTLCILLFAAALAVSADAFAKPDSGTRPAATARATRGGSGALGLGLAIGDPGGIGARYWFSETLAGQASFGYSLQHQGLYGAADVVYGLRQVASPGGMQLDLWGGAGVAVGGAGGLQGAHTHTDPWPYRHDFDDPTRLLLAIRVPVGVSLFLRGTPLEIFAEITPGFRILPSTYEDKSGDERARFRLYGGIGLRYFFGGGPATFSS